MQKEQKERRRTGKGRKVGGMGSQGKVKVMDQTFAPDKSGRGWQAHHVQYQIKPV